MASKVYTASEMRHRADKEQHSYHDNITAAMLRQSADMMDRAEERMAEHNEYMANYPEGGRFYHITERIEDCNYIIHGDTRKEVQNV